MRPQAKCVRLIALFCFLPICCVNAELYPSILHETMTYWNQSLVSEQFLSRISLPTKDILGFHRKLSGWSSKNESWFYDIFEKENDIRRRAKDYLFTEEEKLELVFLHNVYRSNVTPPAGDMAFMEWDEELSRSAQDWAERCRFMHGMPPSALAYGDTVGQNLYRGWDRSGVRALKLWYDEYIFYNFRNRSCEQGQQCGHYTQMVWARSKLLGCGRKLCKKNSVLVVCHYSPAGNLKDQDPYIIGNPCSQCQQPDGGLCTDNLCVTTEQCKRNPGLCEPTCSLKCQNCGLLEPSSCRCQCPDGWDSLDCSKPCSDAHEKCGLNPGYPSQLSCSLSNNFVGEKLCRKMCGKCNERTYDIRNPNLCCAGSSCVEGSVLDLERRLCSCQLLCPGSECYHKVSSSGGKLLDLRATFMYLFLLLLIEQRV